MMGEERREIATLAELFDYVSAAWDTGGASYCATRAWNGTGLSDVFERFARGEGLPENEHPSLERKMLDAMPPCRACGCRRP
jgi:hypothetical protein